jgi:hypothetical protein
MFKGNEPPGGVRRDDLLWKPQGTGASRSAMGEGGERAGIRWEEMRRDGI